MIISASRRTDIPSYYGDWFCRRLQAGYVLARNPMNPCQVSKISLSPEVVDGIVFWTKNPIPMLPRLPELSRYPYYFQFTLNAYGKDVEPNLPAKGQTLIPTFQALSRRIGKDRVVWRYDPIFFNQTYTFAYHCNYFEQLAQRLHAFTDQCTVSFMDSYRCTRQSMKPLAPQVISLPEKTALMGRFAAIAGSYGLRLATCAEALDLEKLGIAQSCCVDKARLEKIGGYPLTVAKDKNQRPACGCAASIDIGMYDTCQNGCLYCYASHSAKTLQRNRQRHQIASPLLCGKPGPEDVVTERAAASCKNRQVDFPAE